MKDQIFRIHKCPRCMKSPEGSEKFRHHKCDLTDGMVSMIVGAWLGLLLAYNVMIPVDVVQYSYNYMHYMDCSRCRSAKSPMVHQKLDKCLLGWLGRFSGLSGRHD